MSSGKISIDDIIFNLRTENYFHQRPHHNLFNKFFFSNFWKTVFPLSETREFTILDRQRSSEWYGSAPQATWVDGVVDYTYNKINRNSIGHFHMHENRKNKPFKERRNGGDAQDHLTLYPTFYTSKYPAGCQRELNLYLECRNNGKECNSEKINIVEVCPKWALERLRENKKALLKATVIDNDTYRRAMKIENYNEGRSLKDITDKNRHLIKLRSDGYWADDRYNPTIYPAPDQLTNITMGKDSRYSDIIGGNIIDLIKKERNEAMSKIDGSEHC